MMRAWLILPIFFLLTAFGVAGEITLKQKLAEAEPGSYLVTEQGKTCTFLHVYEKSDESIVLEEVTIPAARFEEQHASWREWFERGAPGHTLWTLSQINLESGKFEEVFSFTHEGWIDLSQSNSFLTTLLNLRFQEVPDTYRRRIGMPPGHGKPDYRPIWNPRLIVGGSPLAQVPFSAWKARWPSDGTELSRKTVEIYLPEDPWDSHLPAYPTYFPYWVEVEGKIGSAKVRVIDSGTGVHSPKPRLPHRSPHFIGNGAIEGDRLALRLECPDYFKEFVLMAEEADAFMGKSFPLPCTVSREGKIATVVVEPADLEKFMTLGQRYRFSLTPKEDPLICIETEHPIPYR